MGGDAINSRDALLVSIQQDISSFPAKVRAKTKGKTKAVLLEPGDTYEV